jgi:hypothetical protein
MTTLSVESTGTTTAGLRQFEKQIRISSTSENDLFVQAYTFLQASNICEEIFAMQVLQYNFCKSTLHVLSTTRFFIIHPNNYPLKFRQFGVLSELLL